MKKFEPEKYYKFKKDFSRRADPLEYHGEKGEIVEFKGKSLDYGHFYSTADQRLILMTTKEAFQYLEEVN